MGWKTFKEHFNISHMVAIHAGNLCIGSPYIHNIIVINPDGEVIKRYGDGSVNRDLKRYQAEIDQCSSLFLKSLLEAEDTFERSIPVYIGENGKIIEKYCEETGWPNVTHDGQQMYEDDFSTSKQKAIKRAKRRAANRIRWKTENAESALKDFKQRIAWLQDAIAERDQLERDYPDDVGLQAFESSKE